MFPHTDSVLLNSSFERVLFDDVSGISEVLWGLLRYHQASRSYTDKSPHILRIRILLTKEEQYSNWRAYILYISLSLTTTSEPNKVKGCNHSIISKEPQ